MKLYNATRQVLGEMDTQKLIFTKTTGKVTKKWKEPPGWTVEVGIIDTLDIMDIEVVQIIDKKGKVVYTTALKNFTQYGIMVESRNYGQMILVKDEFWEVKPLM
jgi:hypothetical protein